MLRSLVSLTVLSMACSAGTEAPVLVLIDVGLGDGSDTGDPPDGVAPEDDTAPDAFASDVDGPGDSDVGELADVEPAGDTTSPVDVLGDSDEALADLDETELPGDTLVSDVTEDTEDTGDSEAPVCDPTLDCPPASQCKVATCGGGGCSESDAPSGTSCDDGDEATLADQCQAGECHGVPAECSGATDCNDGNACTNDSCTSGACKILLKVNGAACDDGDACSVDDSCVAGVCLGVADPAAAGCAAVGPDEEAFQQALALYSSLDYAGALAAFDAFRSAFPTSARLDNAIFLLARCQFELGLFAAARDAFAAFGEDFPGSPFTDDAAYYLARTDFELLAFGTAADEFQAFLANQSASNFIEFARYYLGRSEYEQGHWAAAVAALQPVIDTPASTLRDAALYWAGRSSYEWGRADGSPGSAHFPEAEAYLLQGIDGYPTSSYGDNLRYYYGMAAWQRGAHAAVVTRMDALLAGYATSTYRDGAAYYAARAEYELAQYPSAISRFDTFIETWPAPNGYRDGALYFAGRAHFQQGVLGVNAIVEFQAAAVRFESVAVESPTSGYADNAHYFGARSHHRLAKSLGVSPAANYAAAIAHYQAVHDQFPASSYADNAWRYEVEADVEQGFCGDAQSALGAFQTTFPSSSELSKAISAVQGC